MPITVLLVDDDALVRAGLRAILEAQPDIEVVVRRRTARPSSPWCGR
ncbi:DNA-binding NarL/FixJ family response regulator [Streptomyces sp. HB132]|nr:DNA-binding NarL/FixJ family response regulator [Streptomyces sp. HB132]